MSKRDILLISTAIAAGVGVALFVSGNVAVAAGTWISSWLVRRTL